MKYKIIFSLVILFCATSLLFAQDNTDQVKINSILSAIPKLPEDTSKIMSISELAELYPDISQERLMYIKEGLDLSEKLDWRPGIGLFHYHLGWYYLFSNNRDLAIENFQKATEFSDSLEVQMYSFGCLSNIHSWVKNHDEALYYATRSVEVAEKSNSVKLQNDALLNMGDAYRYAGNKEKAHFYYYKLYTLLDKEDLSKPSLSTVAAYVYMLDSAVDDPFGIFKYAMKLKLVYDTANPHDKRLYSLLLIKIVLAYTESVESIKIKQLQLEAEENQKWLYIASISFLVIAAMLLIWQNISRQKANKELEKANEMKARFFAILNHDLRRPVAGLISYLQLKTVAPEMIAPEDVAAFEKKTIETTTNLLQNMEDLLFWCKDQMQGFTPEYTQVSVSKLFSDTGYLFNYEERISFKFSTPPDLKITTDENYVKTIMRNLTSNAIAALKDTEDPQIEWSATKVKNKIILAISNNGPAISQETASLLYNDGTKESMKVGLGLKIVRDLSRAIDCQVDVVTGKDPITGEEKGTKFLLSFNNQKKV